MKRIEKAIVGTTNPAKIQAVINVMNRLHGYVRVEGVPVESNVPDQPFGDETILGAMHRAKAAYQSGDCDLGIGIEGGIFAYAEENRYIEPVVMNFQWCAVYDGKAYTMGCGSGFQTPTVVVKQVLGGEEFGKAMDRLTGIEDIGRKEGGIGFMTNGLLTRSQLTEQCVFMALVPLMRPELYRV